MLWLKSCPRCHGDLIQQIDQYGSYTACVQCGHYLTEAEEAQFSLSISRQTTRSALLAERNNVAV